MSKVAITDYNFDSLDLEAAILEPLGCEIHSAKRPTPQELTALVKEADYVITQFAPVTASVIQAMESCKVIVRYGVGVDNVDLEEARKKGIPVCNVPDYCTDEVADHTLALILAVTRRMVTLANSVRSGAWKLPVPSHQVRVLKGMTVGLVGFGRIGREVAERLKPFKCRLMVFDPVVSEADIRSSGCIPVPLEELCKTSDLISLHCPSTQETRGMLNRDAIAKMKPGVLLINVARGDLVGTEDLIEALESGRIGAAGLDVANPEPVPAESPLLKMEQVILSPHVASVSAKAVVVLRESAAKTVACAVRGEPLPNVVNGVGA
jgi:D-3-phosphoglycerate dehydrogenase